MSFLEELAARRRFGMKPGLETIWALCAALGDPQDACRAIHVAGTNGKGAVCALLDAVLRAAGLRVGRYTSPHLVRLNERFFLDGRPVDDEALERTAAVVRSCVRHSSRPDLAELTFFEALTAVAFRLYADAGVDVAVLECGLGGRLDATNVCSPSLCVITKIGLDHCDWLGDTVEKIAAEKAGIVKPGVPVVLGRNDPSVRAVVRARAEELGSPYVYAPDVVGEDELPANLSLAGSFNRENAVTALAAIRTWADGKPAMRAALPAAICRGCSSVVWPGRFQRIGDVIVDGAHNPPAAQALVAALRSASVSDVDLIAGFCGDKDVAAVLSILAPVVTRGFAVRTNNPRSLSAEETAERMRNVGMDAVACPSLRKALDLSRSRKGGGHVTLVCGSLFLAGEALVEIGALPGQSGPVDPSEALVPMSGDAPPRF